MKFSKALLSIDDFHEVFCSLKVVFVTYSFFYGRPSLLRTFPLYRKPFPHRRLCASIFLHATKYIVQACSLQQTLQRYFLHRIPLKVLLSAEGLVKVFLLTEDIVKSFYLQKALKKVFFPQKTFEGLFFHRGP